MTKDTGGFAFPIPASTIAYSQGDEVKHHEEFGMTLRDKFAGDALKGLLSNPNMADDVAVIARACYLYADAMIEERKK